MAQLEPDQVDKTFLMPNREFVPHNGQIQKIKFFPHVIDDTWEDGGDHGLAVEGQDPCCRELLVETASICLSPIWTGLADNFLTNSCLCSKSLVPDLSTNKYSLYKSLVPDLSTNKYSLYCS